MTIEGIVVGLLAIAIGLAWAFYGLKLFTILLPIWAFFFGLVAGAQWGVGRLRARASSRASCRGASGWSSASSWPRSRSSGTTPRSSSSAAPWATPSAIGFFDWLGLGTGLIVISSASSSARSSPSGRSCSACRSCSSWSSRRSAARPRSSTASCCSWARSSSKTLNEGIFGALFTNGILGDGHLARARGGRAVLADARRRPDDHLDRSDQIPVLSLGAAVARRRHRPGDDEQPLHPLRPVGTAGRQPSAGARPDHAAAGLGRARRRRDPRARADLHPGRPA